MKSFHSILLWERVDVVRDVCGEKNVVFGLKQEHNTEIKKKVCSHICTMWKWCRWCCGVGGSQLLLARAIVEVGNFQIYLICCSNKVCWASKLIISLWPKEHSRRRAKTSPRQQPKISSSAHPTKLMKTISFWKIFLFNFYFLVAFPQSSLPSLSLLNVSLVVVFCVNHFTEHENFTHSIQTRTSLSLARYMCRL